MQASRRSIAAITAAARDAVGLAGAGLVSYGAWLIYAPAGFITGGTLLLAGVMLMSRLPRAPGA